MESPTNEEMQAEVELFFVDRYSEAQIREIISSK